MKIRFKILIGFVLLVVMLIIAGLMSIYEFSRISKKVSSLVKDNYKTIEASKTMLEALEREDSGILLLLSGHWQEGEKIMTTADSTFISAMDFAKSNITEEGEEKYIENINIAYQTFKSRWELPMLESDINKKRESYFTYLLSDFNRAKKEVKSLMSLNQDSMYKEAEMLSQQAERAILPGIVAIISAVIFLLIFNFFINRFFVSPIEKLIQNIKSYGVKTQEFSSDVSTHDEIKELENEIHNFVQKFKVGDR